MGYDSVLDHKELTYTIWGDNVKQDIFERWSQGWFLNNTAILSVVKRSESVNEKFAKTRSRFKNERITVCILEK
jgi:hypothetical protein